MSGFLKRLLFPTACPLCGTLKYPDDVEENGCCPSCRSENVYGVGQAKIDMPDFVPSCGSIICCSAYKGKMKDAMRRYKFAGDTYMGPNFGKIAYSLLKQTDILNNTNLISCVPISSEKFKERGYNQSLIIAREISELSGIEYAELLKRNVQGTSQSALLLDERKAKAAVSFGLAEDTCVCATGKHILLIDDILTTGNTMNTCAELLKNAGAAWVTGLCVTGGRKEFM